MEIVANKPARKIVSRSTVRVVGYHASRKMKGLVPWESQIERDYFEWLEVDPNITEFYAQPHTFKFDNFRYTPDALVITHQGSFFVEVKPDKIENQPEEMARLKFISEALAAEHYEFRLVLERVVREPLLRANVVTLSRFIRATLDPTKVAKLIAVLANGPTAISKLINASQLSLPDVMSAIAQGHIHADLTHPISETTVVNIL